jgi:hypothetical protein
MIIPANKSISRMACFLMPERNLMAKKCIMSDMNGSVFRT